MFAISSLFYFYIKFSMYAGVISWILRLKESVFVVKSQIQIPSNILEIGAVQSKSIDFLPLPKLIALKKINFILCIALCRCDFYNYARNTKCLKCNIKQPKEQPNNENEEHIWRRRNWLKKNTRLNFVEVILCYLVVKLFVTDVYVSNFLSHTFH